MRGPCAAGVATEIRLDLVLHSGEEDRHPGKKQLQRCGEHSRTGIFIHSFVTCLFTN